jgi:EAL domain-containing protein (putative c-di-GMP-specific phosphodiesterase class I)
MLMLGAATPPHPHVGVIAAANSRLVRAALMGPAVPRGQDAAAMPTSELRAAVAGSMIEARYQPIVLMSNRRPVALEVLARLKHPVRGMLPPDRFVPQLEDAGLAALLTERISARAFTDLARPGLACGDLRITLNFPLDVLLMPEALDCLEKQRSAAGISASRLTIELTESRPVDDLVTLGRSLERLRRLGYGVAIDDVGHAVPRLAPLLELPFSTLKLDKGMVQQVETSSETREFLERTIQQARSHGLHVVAEGVETVALWHAMHAMGADSAQGFLVARPLPIAAVPIWRDAWDRAPDFPPAA